MNTAATLARAGAWLARADGRLIRINPNEPEVPDPASDLGLALGGRDGIGRLRQALAGR